MSIGEVDESTAAANAASRIKSNKDVSNKSKMSFPVDSTSTLRANDKVGATSTVTPTPTISSTYIQSNRPWYRSGGMVINLVGIVINLIVPLVIMCRVPRDPQKTREQSVYFIRVLLCAWVVAFFTTTRSKTTYCIFVVPTYIVSFIVLPMILQNEESFTPAASSSYTWYNMARILFMTAILASWKINICMSVCMHRYASHAALKCGRWMNIALCILSCAANQGGPLWWASQHRCHHKLRYIYVHVL